MRPRILVPLLVSALLASAAVAVDTVGEASSDSDWSPAIEAIGRGNWPAAIKLLDAVTSRDPGNAEVHNRLGYAYRRSVELTRAFEHYREVLRIAPNHLGAHEYIGEAYVMSGDLPRARDHLLALERLCGRSCPEYRDPAKAIEQSK